MTKKTQSDDNQQPDNSPAIDQELNDEVAGLEKMETELIQAKEQAKRALADYQNLVRRNQEDRQRMAKFASLSVIEDFLEPLSHLKMASEQLKDAGLNMVVQQFNQSLENQGVKEIECVGKPFDAKFMEVIETKPTEKDQKPGIVLKVVKPGYTLFDEVIQHARVIVTGEK